MHITDGCITVDTNSKIIPVASNKLFSVINKATDELGIAKSITAVCNEITAISAVQDLLIEFQLSGSKTFKLFNVVSSSNNQKEIRKIYNDHIEPFIACNPRFFDENLYFLEELNIVDQELTTAKAIFYMPFRFENQPQGALTILLDLLPDERFISVEVPRILAILTYLVARTLHVLTTLNMKNHAEDLAIVNKTGEVVTSFRTINEMANEIAVSINNRFEADEINIIRYDKESNQLITLATITNNQESSNSQAAYPLSDGMNSWIVNNARSLLIREDSLSECESLGIRHGGKPAKSWIGVPMCYRDTIIGVLSLQSYNKANLYNKWTEEILAVLATQCAIAIENSRLFDELLLREKENKNLRESLLSMHKFDFIIGSSGKFREVLELAARAAKVRSTVTILGPTGAGKEVLAKAIHYNSPRSKAPFIKVNCAAVPESLLEVELFGIEKSVATGVDARSGKFEAAEGGTLFLDEIGDMALATQAKVLRAIQEHEIERIGSNITKKLDIRIIAATNKDIHQLISENKFREDLYYRLNVLVIKIPPLSERRDDIADLAEYFLKKSCTFNNIPLKSLSTEAIEKLRRYDWPGNVRELENSIERAVITIDTPIIYPDTILEHQTVPASGASFSIMDENLSSLNGAIAEFEKNIIIDSLKRNGYKQNKVAAELGVSARSIWYKIKKYSIEIEGMKLLTNE